MDGITFSIAVVDAGNPTPASGANKEGGTSDDLFQALLAQALAAGPLVPGQPVFVDVLPVAAGATDVVSAVASDDRLPVRLVRLQTPEGSTLEALIGKLPLPDGPGRQVFDVTEAVRLIAETADAAQAQRSAPTVETDLPASPVAVEAVPTAIEGKAVLAAPARATPATTNLPAGAKVLDTAVPITGTPQQSDAATPATAGATPDNVDRAVRLSDHLDGPPTTSAPESAADRISTASLVHRFVDVRSTQHVEHQAPPPAADLVRQVADQIQRLSLAGKSELSFQLQPESLGRLDVRISVEGGNVTVQLGTQTGEARGLIENNLSQLRSALAEQGLRVDRLVVYVGHGLAGFDGSAQQQRAWDTRPRTRHAQIEAVEPAEGQSGWWHSSGKIDCRV